MKNILIKNSSMILLGIVVLCLTLFWIFSDAESSHYLVDFVPAKNKSTEIFELDTKDNILQPLYLSDSATSLETKKEITNSSPVYLLAFSAYLNNFSSELLMAADLQEKFDRDEVDPAIATAAEKDLAYVFYQGMEWQEFVPQDISCKQHICRLVLVLEYLEHRSRLANLISEQLMTRDIGFAYVIPVSLPIEKQEIIYFIRDDVFKTSSGVLP